MIELSKHELEKIAKMSGLKISDQEAEEFVFQLKSVIGYTDEIMGLDVGSELEAFKSVNVFREDKVYSQDEIDANLVFQKKEDDYLSVPKILD